MSKVRFKQISPSMYGGIFALSDEGDLWVYDKYDQWNRVKSPDSSQEVNSTYQQFPSSPSSALGKEGRPPALAPSRSL